MKVGDLVKWVPVAEPVNSADPCAGIVIKTMGWQWVWLYGDTRWVAVEDLEVISESR